MSSKKYQVGEVRPSQILWTYGPGALIDLPSLSVITMGIDHWEKDRCQTVEEARLLTAVRNEPGCSHVKSLLVPPYHQSENNETNSEKDLIGIPVRPFPRWFRCVQCGLLSEYDLGLFKFKDSYRPENRKFVHMGCKRGKDADAVPARFLLACRNGHLDDFPWHYFVHGGQSTCAGMLRFFEDGASLQTENLWVKCDCGASRSMATAFGKSGKSNLPRCRGRHPHLGHWYDNNCEEQPRTVLLGATNSWFPITRSALAIPRFKDPVYQLVQDGWNYFDDANSEDEVAVIVNTLEKMGVLSGIDKHKPAAIWAAVELIRSGEEQPQVSETDINGPEWEVLIDPNARTEWPHFLSKSADVPKGFENRISGVLLLERLRVVHALIGFTRVEAPEETDDPDERPPMAALSADSPEWVPAGQVHGEGIFIRFDENALQKWERLESVKARDKELFAGHARWRNSRKLEPGEGYPGIRYVLLHTISHLLIRELALECGYSAASISERIYAYTEGETPQAGILIYTAAADSDGTLGGLVELGVPKNLGRLIEQSLKRARVCSSDPLCAEHKSEKDRSLHAAACHACSFVSETSCEKGNRYLDRGLVVPTLEDADAAFFSIEDVLWTNS